MSRCSQGVIVALGQPRWCDLDVNHDGKHHTVYRKQPFLWTDKTSVTTPTVGENKP